MKSLFKFALLSALIVGGRLAKQPAPASMAQAMPSQADNGSVVLVHQVLTSEPVPPAKEQNQPQNSGNGLIAELF
ncbi:hypothetical protein GCM10022409_27830 [Hymenobacter glaciei]|uniref:Uncharacterized protein n=1 Tax=Hymenobacter glaciei TaxID=877209 RepID=A0ABP7UCS4_9BACT